MADDRTTSMLHKGRLLTFNYDHSFWSLPEPRTSGGAGLHFASQELIYARIGRPLLDKSLEGFNVSLFAYGQVGKAHELSLLSVLKALAAVV